MLPSLPLLCPSAVRLDVCALADLVSLRDPGWPERPRMVGAANGPSPDTLSPQRQQVLVGAGLVARPAVARPAVADRLGAGMGCLATASPSVASRTSGRPVLQVQLDHVSERMGHGRGLSRAESFGAVVRPLGASSRAYLQQQ